MPTIDQLNELLNNCTWELTTLNGVNGYKVTSNTNSNSIFLPAAGCRWVSLLNFAGDGGYYWSASVDEDYCDYAQDLSFYRVDHGQNYNDRSRGQSVRPVRAQPKE